MKTILFLAFTFICFSVLAETNVTELKKQLFSEAENLEKELISLRRDFHQHPELGNREFRTSKIVAKYLEDLGLEVQTNVAKTGVVALLKGTKPGSVIAFRADMDALPVSERNNLPFKSLAKGEYRGEEVPVMHACGHDTHIAILLITAKILSKHKEQLSGQIKFIFQPAEEGAPEGEEGGAELMVKEGVLENPKVEAIFGLHINSQTPVGVIAYKPGGIMAAVSSFKVVLHGKQSHGAYPWSGVDPIVTAAQIINSLQTIVSRNVNLPANPAVVTVGKIQGGVRSNIIPEQVEMLGTIRTLGKDDQKMVSQRFREIVENVSKSMNVKADITLPNGTAYPVTFNDYALVDKMLPSLQEAAGKENTKLTIAHTGAEDFALFSEVVPGFYFFLGGMPKGEDPTKAPAHHTPDFFIDESGLVLGVKAFTAMAVDYLDAKK